MLLLVEAYIVADFEKPPDLLKEEETEEFKELLDYLGLSKRNIAMHALQ